MSEMVTESFNAVESALREWAQHMDQWERWSFVDSAGNRIYVKIDYYGDGYEYDNLEACGDSQVLSPGISQAT